MTLSLIIVGGLHIHAPFVEFGSPQCYYKIRMLRNLLIISPTEGIGLIAASNQQSTA